VLADVLTLESRDEEGERLRRDMKLPDPLKCHEKKGEEEKVRKGKAIDKGNENAIKRMKIRDRSSRKELHERFDTSVIPLHRPV
jgi:hypothetical protein